MHKRNLYHKLHLNTLLSKAILRLTTIGIDPHLINSHIQQESEKLELEYLTDVSSSSDRFSPLETLIISQRVFEKLVIEKANVLLEKIREAVETGNYTETQIRMSEFQILTDEHYYFNENLPDDYKIGFDLQFFQYEQLKKQSDRLQHPQYV